MAFSSSMTTPKYQALKRLIYSLDGGICHICGKPLSFDEATLDHIIPTAISGRGDIESSDEYWNIRLAHRKCNWKRSDGKIGGQLRLNIPTERNK